jgi:hypothetical protein
VTASFGIVFIAEWGDLAHVGTAARAADYGAPITVFVGATAALWMVTGIAVFVGNRAGTLLDPNRTKRIAAVVFGIVGIALLSGKAMRMCRPAKITLIALVIGSRPALPALWFNDDGKALPCRPTIACTADIVPPGSFELEAGYFFRKLRSPILQHSVPFLAKLTLAEWVQLQVGGNGPTFANSAVPARYVDDIVTGFKFHLTDQARYVPSLSWSIELSSPLAAAAGYIRTYDLLATLYFTKDFSWLHADFNVGFNLWRLDGPLLPQPWVALALSVELPAHFTVMAENYFFADASPVASRDGGLLLAVAFAARPWLVLDVGGDIGYFASQRSVSAFVGMTILPVDFWESASERRKMPRQR